MNLFHLGQWVQGSAPDSRVPTTFTLVGMYLGASLWAGETDLVQPREVAVAVAFAGLVALLLVAFALLHVTVLASGARWALMRDGGGEEEPKPEPDAAPEPTATTAAAAAAVPERASDLSRHIWRQSLGPRGRGGSR